METARQKSWRPAEFAKRHGISVAMVYKQIAQGKLRGRKIGAATIITDKDEAHWLSSLKPWMPTRRAETVPAT
jgi:hypothetical protein